MSKYGNRVTVIDNIRFASRAEAQRYQELKILAHAGVITDLRVQPRFVLQEKFVDGSGCKQRAIEYVADFQYTDTQSGRIVAEDVKGGRGTRTAVFEIKRKLFLKRYQHIDFRVLEA